MKSDIPEEYQEGWTRFLNCHIDLAHRTLIPRPETEFWARQAIINLAKLKGDIRVLDIFAGSGCVGIAVAKNIGRAAVDFADIDSSAVAQIKKNCRINGIDKKRAKIFESDVFEKIPRNANYDAILANPPYIDPSRACLVQKSVLDWEPRRALFAADQGLAIIEKFLKQAKFFLKPEGFIFVEFDPCQKQDIMKIIKKSGYSTFEFFKDQFKKWRFVKIAVN